MSQRGEKCADPTCNRKAAPGQKYCSRFCAPSGHLSTDRGKRTKYTPSPEDSGTQEPGGAFPVSSSAELPTESALQSEPERTKSANANESTTAARESAKRSSEPSAEERTPPLSAALRPIDGDAGARESLSTPERSGASGTPATESGTAQTSGDGGTLETQLVASLQPSTSISAAKLTSLDLIDSSAEHLYGLMKSVATEDPLRRKDPRVIQAAANCAKQIKDLIRLKLDVLKEVRTSGN